MGGEFGQAAEWNHDKSLDWHLLDQPMNAQLQQWVRALNDFYRNTGALYETDFDADGFEWIDFHDQAKSVISFIRKSKDQKKQLIIVCNFTPIPRYNYRVGVPDDGVWVERLNSDAKEYGGSGHGNMGQVEAGPASFYGKFDYTVQLTLPPLSILVLEKGA
jgi:1,4-alpha-glucan branching enzyme